MRVTKTMKGYIHRCVERKVADRVSAAEKAKKAQDEKDSKALTAVRDYAKALIPDMTKKVAAFAKGQGLTWLDHRPLWSGFDNDVNIAFDVCVDTSDFEELNSYDGNKSAARKAHDRVNDEPERIRAAVDRAVNEIVVSLELGKVVKAELEGFIASTDVEGLIASTEVEP